MLSILAIGAECRWARTRAQDPDTPSSGAVTPAPLALAARAWLLTSNP